MGNARSMAGRHRDAHPPAAVCSEKSAPAMIDDTTPTAATSSFTRAVPSHETMAGRRARLRLHPDGATRRVDDLGEPGDASTTQKQSERKRVNPFALPVVTQTKPCLQGRAASAHDRSGAVRGFGNYVMSVLNLILAAHHPEQLSTHTQGLPFCCPRPASMRWCFHKRCCARIFAPAVGVGLRHDRRLRDRVWSRRSSARSDVERSRWSARSNRAGGLSGMSNVPARPAHAKR